ncbi:MAG TPA: hypothetical protein VJV78_15050 [Polyangiales bacterium]|nr:hypothetical protein [Polyangiales bacterium]
MLRIPTPFLASALLAAISCSRSSSAPEPVAPVQPIAPRAPSAEPAAAPTQAEPPPAAPPKEGTTDAPQTATAAPAERAAEEKPPAGALPAPDAQKKKARGRTREIHRTPGNTACLEMYGTCTPPPDQICTSSALYVDCGQRAQVPTSGEWVHCVCD